jgi:hypothetical protein
MTEFAIEWTRTGICPIAVNYERFGAARKRSELPELSTG